MGRGGGGGGGVGGGGGGGGGGGMDGWMDGWIDDTPNGFSELFFCTHGQNAIALAKGYDAIY